ncbi:MAG: ATP-binding protein [Blastocatellia bacterium]|nr:ATP-binding protein [Blastocatellia bacterium]
MGESRWKRPFHLSLHARVALSIAALVLLIFGALLSISLSTMQTLVREENQRRAELLAAQLAQHLSSEQKTDLAALRTDALSYRQAHSEIREIHIYSLTRSGVREVITVPMSTSENLPSMPVPLDLLGEAQQGRVASRLEAVRGKSYHISAGAPIESGGKPIGFVVLRTEMAYGKALLERMNRLAWLALLVAITGITVALHLLFRRLIYRPIRTILDTMHHAETGDLRARVPVTSQDEMGTLSLGLNALLARVQEMTEALETEQQRLEGLVREATAELSERNRQLQEANLQLFAIQRQLLHMERLAAAGYMAAQFAHEIGTPLNLISGHIQLLRTRTHDEEGIRRLTIILGQIERIERIVRRLLDATRRPRWEHLPLRIESLLSSIVEIVMPTLQERKIEVSLELAPDLPEILSSPEQLQQVLINVIANSLDAMPAGGRLTLRAFVAGTEKVIIECADTGIGMSPDVLAHIFEPFFTTKANERGSGLGLSIVRQIVKEHGGEITVHSEPGQGTIVRLAFPTLTARRSTSESEYEEDSHRG